MADVVTTSIQQNGWQNYVVNFTNLSDSTGESGVTKVNATSAGNLGVLKGGQTFYPGIHLPIRKVIYSIRGMGLRIQWDATADQDALILGEGTDEQDFMNISGLRVPNGLAGATGSILFTTVAAAANSSYSVTLHCRKNIQA